MISQGSSLDDVLQAELNNRTDHVAEIERCWADFWHFAKYVRTKDEDEQGKIRPLPLDWAYLHEIVEALNDDDPVLVVPKSRRMIITTIVAAWCDWNMLRTDQEAGDLWSACMISINEKKAKKFVERVDGIYDELPVWLQRPWSVSNQTDHAIKYGGSLEALHARGDGPRSEGYAVGVMDEAGFQQNARNNYDALRQCARKTVLISSANGRGNLFDEMWDDKTVRVLELHYTRHPNRDPETEVGKQWYIRSKTGQSEAAWQREQEMNRDVYATTGYFGADWTRAVVSPVDWDGKSIISLGADYAYTNAGAVWAYVNEDKQWCRLGNMLRHDVKIDEFYGDLFQQLQADYPDHKLRIAPDWARGRQHGSTGNTDVDEVRKAAKAAYGRDVLVSTSRIENMRRARGHQIQRTLFVLRADGKYGTVIDPKCDLLIQGFSGAYGPKEGATPHQINDLEEPDHERKQVHVMDADRYDVCEFMRVVGRAEYSDQGRRVSTGGPVLSDFDQWAVG